MSKKVTLLAVFAVVVSGLLFTGCTKKPDLDLSGLKSANPQATVEDSGEVVVDTKGDPLGKGAKGGDFVPGEGDNANAGLVTPGIGGGQGGLGGPVDGKGGAGQDGDTGTGWDSTDNAASPTVGGGGVAEYENGGYRLANFTVYFAYDQSDIPAIECGKLDTLAKHLGDNPAQHVTVEGHTDSRGSEKYNRGLGERRALAVKNYLVTMGVDAARVQTISFGEDKPAVADAKGEAEFKLNRRAEFVIGVPVKK